MTLAAWIPGFCLLGGIAVYFCAVVAYGAFQFHRRARRLRTGPARTLPPLERTR